MSQIIVTTGDIHQPYDILGPIYFQVSNKGLLSSSLDKLKSAYSAEIQRMRSQGNMSEFRADWGFLYGEWSVGQSDFEAAFFIATEELKKRARRVGADAVICMRQDIDMDTNGFAYFYLQMYGTAVKFRKQSASFSEQYEQAEELMSQGNFEEAENLYFSLGDFRDSREKAKAAYAALLSAKYSRAEELMANQKYSEAAQLFITLRNYLDSKEKAEKAQLAHEDQKLSRYSLIEKSADGKQVQFALFLSQASEYTRITDILTLWKSFTWESEKASTIGKKISEAAQIERMYGSSPASTKRFLDELSKMA